MTTILVRHKVSDFAKWQAGFYAADALHSKAGVKHAQVLRGVDDPNEVIVLTEFESVDRARAFAQLEELRKTMHDAGVVGQPDVVFLDKAGTRSWS